MTDLTNHDYSVIESKTEYETGWYTGGYDLVELPDGRTKRFYWAELPPAAVVVAIVDDPADYGFEGSGRSLVMVEQFRPTIRELCYELPAGIVEDDETFAETGARELAEETGLVPAETKLLESFWCSTGVLRHRRGIVYADGFETTDRKLDGTEFLEVRTVPIEDTLSVARSESANDATLEGVLLARDAGHL